MSKSNYPTIKVLIKPAFDSNGYAAGLYISLTLQSPDITAGCALVSFPTAIKTTKLRSRVESLKATDQEGVLPVRLKDDANRWIVERPTSGDVMVLYEAVPSKANTSSSPFDLSSDQGGLIGSGLSFMPGFQSAQDYQNTVEWDLSQAPAGTRAVWTFGEGPSPTDIVGPASVLCESVYMVGPIQSSAPSPISGTLSHYYGYYWFGDLPSTIEVIKDIHYDFFVKVSDFFQDAPSDKNPYRSFVQQTSSGNAFGGTSFTRSHIFTYDAQRSLAHDYDLIRHLAYEMVFLFLGPSVTEPSIDWLFEGIKNVLSIYLPFRTGFCTSDYFQHTMAMHCMKYYTNPLIHLPHEEALALAPSNEYARELISAQAWTFVILTDFRTRKVAEEKRPDLMPRPMEDMAIKPLAVLRRQGELHGIEQFLTRLAPLMGDETRNLYEHMQSGSKIILPEKFFGAKTHLMKTVQLEMLDFGMDRNSFVDGVVTGLKDGSRAEKAGLRDGDVMVRTSPVWKCVDYFDAEMEVVVRREGVETSVSYWPRSFEKVEGLKFVKIEEK